MPRLIDLIGQKFGRLTVIGRAENGARNRIRWLCRCECGQETVVRGDALRKGTTRSCGCLLRETASRRSPRLEDLSGKRFGRLAVISRADNSRDGRVRWLCRCDCGKETVVTAGRLRSGETQSCGCLKRELTSARSFKDRIGERFGRLVAIERAPNGKNGQVRWLCRCDCGQETVVARSSLQRGLTQSCGCLWLERVRAAAKKNATPKTTAKLPEQPAETPRPGNAAAVPAPAQAVSPQQPATREAVDPVAAAPAQATEPAPPSAITSSPAEDTTRDRSAATPDEKSTETVSAFRKLLKKLTGLG